MAKRKPEPSPAGGGLRDAVLTLATAGRRGIAAWHQRLPADVLDELRQIRRDFHEGRVAASRWRLASVISAQLAERGHSGCTQLVVDRWLAHKD